MSDNAKFQDSYFIIAKTMLVKSMKLANNGKWRSALVEFSDAIKIIETLELDDQEFLLCDYIRTMMRDCKPSFVNEILGEITKKFGQYYQELFMGEGKG